MNQVKKTGLELLREKFPDHQISLLPKPYKKDSEKGNCSVCGGYHGLPAAHLEYVGHAALTDRLLDADPNWNWEPLSVENGLPKFDVSGGLWIKLTVCGTTRLGYGHATESQYKDVGAREKEVIGDALRNAAMRFGAALDLWHKGDLHLDENQENQTPKQPQSTQSTILSTPNSDKVSEPQLKRLWAMSKALNWSMEDVFTKVKQEFKKAHPSELSRQEYTLLTSKMQVEIDRLKPLS